jgi:ADP-heptose:LPS heptosyltransferase
MQPTSSSSSESPTKGRTLLLNLTRFGDLLQTQPVISGLHRAGQDVGLVCLANFASATCLLNHLGFVRDFPGADFLTRLDKDWRDAVLSLACWARGAQADFTPQAIANLTASRSARLLASLLNASANEPARLEGFYLDPYGFGASSNPWASFLLASSQNRGCSPFNLVDLFWKTNGLPDEERGFELRRPERSPKLDALFEPLRGAPAVAFQLGASENRRRWPVASFAALGAQLKERLGLTPVLLGSSSEQELGQRYAEAGGPGLDLIGKTSLTELADALLRCERLVTNDTGTMHLAAGLDVPVLAIFLCTAQPWDTGPYKAGALCLEPDLACHPCPFGRPCPHGEQCRRAITPELVFELIRAQRDSHAPTLPPGARVWRTRVEDAHFMGLESLSGHEREDRTQWVRLQRHVYRHFLDQRPVPAAPFDSRLSPEFRQALVQALDQSGKMLGLLAEQGRVLAHTPLPPLKKKFMATWQRLQSLWDQTPPLSVLGLLWITQSQDAAGDMRQIARLIERYSLLAAALQEQCSAGASLA